MPSEPMEMMLMFGGLIVGLGVIDKQAMPSFFYYIVAPIISAIAMVLLLEQVPVFGYHFDLDRYLNFIFRRQANLAKSVGMGLVIGALLRLTAGRLMKPRAKKPKARRQVFDTNISMVRRKHLRMLGLRNTAGPRDIMMAWTRLSSELQTSKWESLLEQRGIEGSEEDLKQWIDEAYHWLRTNSEEANKAGEAEPNIRKQTQAEQPKRARMRRTAKKNTVVIRGL